MAQLFCQQACWYRRQDHKISEVVFPQLPMTVHNGRIGKTIFRCANLSDDLIRVVKYNIRVRFDGNIYYHELEAYPTDKLSDEWRQTAILLGTGKFDYMLARRTPLLVDRISCSLSKSDTGWIASCQRH